jgi:hypothetical protein
MVAQTAQTVPRIDKLTFPISLRGPEMGQEQKIADLEMLARMAARLAGRDPDEHVEVRVGHDVVFDDVVWRYPDFVRRASAAYDLLHGGNAF